jgi:hypothetical protein
VVEGACEGRPEQARERDGDGEACTTSDGCIWTPVPKRHTTGRKYDLHMLCLFVVCFFPSRACFNLWALHLHLTLCLRAVDASGPALALPCLALPCIPSQPRRVSCVPARFARGALVGFPGGPPPACHRVPLSCPPYDASGPSCCGEQAG